MAAKAPAHTTQTTEVKLPKWVDKASQSNYQLAQKLARQKEQYYSGPMVADQSQLTTDSYDLLKSGIGAEDPLYANAAALTGRVTELDPIYGQAQGILSKSAGPWDPQPYLNPFTEEVEKRSISNAERALSGQLSAAGDKARKAGAFGGSTAALQQGMLAAEGARGIGDLSAELRRAGYDKATADMLADRASMRESAAGMIGGAERQGAGWNAAARGYLDTAQGSQANRFASISALAGAGKQEQAQRQALIDADIGKFEDKKGEGLRKLNTLLASLGMSPYGKTEDVEKTGTSESQGPDFATLGLGLLQTIMGLSDRRDKTDIKKLGVDPNTGLPMYAYRYKGDPKGYPKIVGPMAQDVEKVYPDMVSEVGGHKVIHAGVLA